MSIITTIKAGLLAVSVRPWQVSPTVLANREKIAVIEKPVDGSFIETVSNNVDKFLALYDAVKAYQPRMASGRAPLTSQRTAIVKALAALDV
jgi:hypothetical protein